MKKTIVFIFLYIVSLAIIISTIVVHPIDRTPFPIIRMIIIFFATILLSKYFVYMTLSPVYDIWAKRRDIKFRNEIASYHPKVSVIIPAWNEEVGIVKTVQSVLANTYAGEIEAIVVNDGSTDNSDAIMRKFEAEYKEEDHPGRSLIYHYKDNGGKGRALNAGVLISTGEIIMSIDADCFVTPTAVQNFVKAFVDPKVMAAVGNVKIGNTKTVLGTVQYLEFLFSFYFKKADSVMNTIYIIGGAAGAFRRDLFEKIGLYSPHHITEDIEFSVRIQEAGLRIVYAADAVVYTEGASDLESLMSQRLRWKRGRFQTFWEHRELFFSPQEGRSRLLTVIVLPLALFGDLQLFGEIFFVIFLYMYSLWTNNFSSFISGIIVVSSMFAVQLFDDKEQRKDISFFFLAPIGWMLFYLSTYVEHNALLQSVWDGIKGRDIKWQSWNRKGVLDAKTATAQDALPT